MPLTQSLVSILSIASRPYHASYLSAAAITGISDMCMCYSAEEYARVIIWCLGWALDGWPWHIPFTNLSNIKGGVRPLRLLKDLWLSGTLRFVR
ncbi:hypothetical protein DICSQDRAFT_72297, partial [Dichomitus squalens LYAD-421 SS1]